MSTPAPLYIVITDFDGWEQTETCLRRLAGSTFKHFKVIVVDHGSSEVTAKGLEQFPACIRIPAESSLWWAGATNVGIRTAQQLGARHVMLLNNDCYVGETTLAEMMAHVEATAGQVIAPLQCSPHSGEIVVARTATCFTLGFPTFVLPYMKDISAAADNRLPTKMIVGGRGVVIPVEVFDEIGLFDEAALPHYGADHDFYMRCRKHNVPLAIASDASVEIDETRTTAARNLGTMTWRQFAGSWQDPRSHRNIATLTTLFKRHYPIRPLYFIGVLLNTARYCLSYAARRAWYFLKRPS